VKIKKKYKKGTKAGATEQRERDLDFSTLVSPFLFGFLHPPPPFSSFLSSLFHALFPLLSNLKKKKKKKKKGERDR